MIRWGTLGSQTLIVLHQHFHWAGVKHDITLFVKTCEPCQRIKVLAPTPLSLQKLALFQPLDHVHIDLFGPYERMLSKPPTGKQDTSKVWVVLMTDYFT